MNEKHVELLYDNYKGEKYIRYEEGDHNAKRSEEYVRDMCEFLYESFTE